MNTERDRLEQAFRERNDIVAQIFKKFNAQYPPEKPCECCGEVIRLKSKPSPWGSWLIDRKRPEYVRCEKKKMKDERNRVKKVYDNKKLNGQCIYCYKPAITKTRCSEHSKRYTTELQ